jgi:hypothetical protein
MKISAMRNILMAILVSLVAVVLPVRAATNYQDMWWVPSESGWGVNVAQQGNTMFATWFIYSTNRQPLWLVMSNAQRSGAAGNTFTGDLYQTVGTGFSQAPFVALVPADVTKVGTATFTFSSARAGTLSYTVNGAQVVKQITRQPLENVSLAGTYGGGIFRSGSGCATPALNGTSSGTSLIQISHSTATGAATITEVGGFGCRLTGTLAQYGSSFEGSGTYQCAGDALLNGNWTAVEGTGGEATFSLKLNFRPLNDTCTVTGSVGGFKQQ